MFHPYDAQHTRLRFVDFYSIAVSVLPKEGEEPVEYPTIPEGSVGIFILRDASDGYCLWATNTQRGWFAVFAYLNDSMSAAGKRLPSEWSLFRELTTLSEARSHVALLLQNTRAYLEVSNVPSV